jgi:hypothetical protein
VNRIHLGEPAESRHISILPHEWTVGGFSERQGCLGHDDLEVRQKLKMSCTSCRKWVSDLMLMVALGKGFCELKVDDREYSVDTRVLCIDTDIQNFCDLSLIKITEIMSISQK